MMLCRYENCENSPPTAELCHYAEPWERADFLGRLDPGYIFGKDNYPTSKSIGRCPDVRAPVFENDGPSGMKLEKVRASFLDLRSYKNILVDYVVYHFLRYRAKKVVLDHID